MQPCTLHTLEHLCGPSSPRATRTPLEAELVQLGHPLRRDPRVRVAGIQPLLVPPLGVDPPGQLRVGRPVSGHLAVPVPRHGIEGHQLGQRRPPTLLVCEDRGGRYMLHVAPPRF